MVENNIFMSAREVAETLSISNSSAYSLIREMNSELKELGYLTIAGKVNRQFFIRKFFYSPSDTDLKAGH